MLRLGEYMVVVEYLFYELAHFLPDRSPSVGDASKHEKVEDKEQVNFLIFLSLSLSLLVRGFNKFLFKLRNYICCTWDAKIFVYDRAKASFSKCCKFYNEKKNRDSIS